MAYDKVPNHEFWNVTVVPGPSQHAKDLKISVKHRRHESFLDFPMAEVFHGVIIVQMADIQSINTVDAYVKKMFPYEFEVWTEYYPDRPVGPKDRMKLFKKFFGIYSQIGAKYPITPNQFMSDEEFNTIETWIADRSRQELIDKIKDIFHYNPTEKQTIKLILRKALKKRKVRQRKSSAKKISSKRNNMRKVKYAQSKS